MKRSAVAFALLAALGGCVSTETGANVGGPMIPNGPNVLMSGPNTIPGAVGPGGVPVPVRAQAANAGAPSGEDAAKAFIAQRMPPDVVRQVAAENGDRSGILLAGGAPFPGQPAMPPGGGMVPPGGGMPGQFPNGAVAAVGALTGHYAGQFAAARTEVRFLEPRGMKVSWMLPGPDGRRVWNNKLLEAPASYNFAQAAIYRLKLSDIPDYPGVDLYPTVEVVPAKERAMTFLAHSAVPVSFTAEDFRMVASNNYVVKVIYLPDPQYQDVAVGGGLGELISTQLEPGLDPIAEATKRGSILLIVRLGNIDLELRHSPAMDAAPPRPAGPPMMPPGMGRMPPGMMPPGMMAPGMMPAGVGPMQPGFPGRPAPTMLPGAQGADGLPPLPPQTNPPTPAQIMAGQQGR